LGARSLIDSGNTEAITIVEAMCPSPNLSLQKGIGGNDREVGSASAPGASSREVPKFAHDQVRDQLRKAKKLMVSNVSFDITVPKLTKQAAETPANLVLPDVMSALHLATKLSLWPLYRHSVVLFAMLMLSMDGAGLAGKVKDLLLEHRDQVGPPRYLQGLLGLTGRSWLVTMRN
jgi:hypothetical protein